MKRKYLIIVSLALALSIFMLSGCNKGQDSKNAENKRTDDLKWYMLGSINTDLDRVFEEVSKMTKEKIGVGIKMYQVANPDYSNKVQTMINSGEEFDLCFTNNTMVNYAQNARKGSFVEISDLLTKYGKEMTALIPNEVFEQAKVDGKLYGVPTYKEMAWQNVWMINVPVAKKYGIDYKKEITTLEEIEPILKKIKEGEKDDKFTVLAPFSAGMIDILPFERISGSIFGVKYNPNDIAGTFEPKVQNIFESNEAKKHLKTMRSYFEKGYLSRDVGGTNDVFKTGKWFLGLQSYQPQYEIADSISKGYEIGIVNRHTPVSSGTTGAVNAIPITSKRPGKAMEFLNMLNTNEKLRMTVSYGIEKVHYNIENGRRVMTDEGKKNYSAMPHYALGNLFLTGLSQNDNPDKWKAFDEYNKTAVKSPLLGFFFNSEPIRNELAAVDNVVKQYNSDLIFGRVDPEVMLPEFLAKLKGAGADKIQAEMQKQLDQFLSNKK